MRKLDIGVIGCGVVGGALVNYLTNNGWDGQIKRNDPRLQLHDDVSDCDVAFICVPAETKQMQVDLTNVHNAIEKCKGVPLIVLRTTVTPGTCDMLTKQYGKPIVFMPEFLTERTAWADMGEMDLIVGFPELKNPIVHQQIKLEGIFKHKLFDYMTAKEAEMAKYAHNVFGAAKVTFFNGIRELCEIEKISYEEVRRGFLNSGYINAMHTMVPGPDGQFGFGGKCFPKDLEAFIGYVKSNPLHLFLKDIFCLNRFYRGEKEYEHTKKENTELASEAR